MRSLVFVIIAALLLSGCAQSKVICGVEYRPYGLLSADEDHNPKIKYEVVWGNVFWSIVFAETIIAPLYFGGFSLFQPIGPMPKIKGAETGECDGRI